MDRYRCFMALLVIFLVVGTGCKSWVTVESKHMDAEIARMNATAELYKAMMEYEKGNKLLSLELDDQGKVQKIEVGQQTKFDPKVMASSMVVDRPSQHPVANSVNHVTDRIVDPLSTGLQYLGIGYIAKQVKGSNTNIDGEGNEVNINSGNTATLDVDSDVTKYTESDVDQSNNSDNSNRANNSVDNTDNSSTDNRNNYNNDSRTNYDNATETPTIVEQPEPIIVDPVVVTPDVIDPVIVE